MDLVPILASLLGAISKCSARNNPEVPLMWPQNKQTKINMSFDLNKLICGIEDNENSTIFAIFFFIKKTNRLMHVGIQISDVWDWRNSTVSLFLVLYTTDLVQTLVSHMIPKPCQVTFLRTEPVVSTKHNCMWLKNKTNYSSLSYILHHRYYELHLFISDILAFWPQITSLASFCYSMLVF